MKTILITCAPDGIGLAAAELLAAEGHALILHGRNPKKLETVSVAVGDVFADASGKYFDNAAKEFAPGHGDVMESQKTGAVIAAIDSVIARVL